MNAAAFVLLAAMLAAYVILDGWDLGVGAIHLFYARTQQERAASFAAIGPFWSGNEVVLLAAAATLFAIFPRVYAASFSGFYLPFMIVLWLLMVRGMAMELRGHFRSDMWRGFWDVAFSLSSMLLALLFGVALGNIVRGVPLDARGYFTGTFHFLLNGYALAVGLLALAALAMHGATYLTTRLGEPLASKALRLAQICWIVVVALFALVTLLTLRVHPVPGNAVLWIAPAGTVIALLCIRLLRGAFGRFAASCAFLTGLVASAAQTIFPYLLPAFPIGSGGLDIHNGGPGGYSAGVGFAAALIGCAAALLYGTLAARRMLGRLDG